MRNPAKETMLCLFGGWAVKHLLDEVTMPPRAYLKQRAIETEGMIDESDFIEAMAGDAVCRAYHIGFKEGYNQGV